MRWPHDVQKINGLERYGTLAFSRWINRESPKIYRIIRRSVVRVLSFLSQKITCSPRSFVWYRKITCSQHSFFLISEDHLFSAFLLHDLGRSPFLRVLSCDLRSSPFIRASSSWSRKVTYSPCSFLWCSKITCSLRSFFLLSEDHLFSAFLLPDLGRSPILLDLSCDLRR